MKFECRERIEVMLNDNHRSVDLEIDRDCSS